MTNDKRLIGEKEFTKIVNDAFDHIADDHFGTIRDHHIAKFNALEVPQKWIPYKSGDVVPVDDNDDDYEFLCTANDSVYILWLIDNTFCYDSGAPFDFIVTAYMELPTPYTKKGS